MGIKPQKKNDSDLDSSRRSITLIMDCLFKSSKSTYVYICKQNNNFASQNHSLCLKT